METLSLAISVEELMPRTGQALNEAAVFDA
jgi:hypothetical protein